MKSEWEFNYIIPKKSQEKVHSCAGFHDVGGYFLDIVAPPISLYDFGSWGVRISLNNATMFFLFNQRGGTNAE